MHSSVLALLSTTAHGMMKLWLQCSCDETSLVTLPYSSSLTSPLTLEISVWDGNMWMVYAASRQCREADVATERWGLVLLD